MIVKNLFIINIYAVLQTLSLTGSADMVCSLYIQDVSKLDRQTLGPDNIL